MPKVKFPSGVQQIADDRGTTYIADDLGHAEVPHHALHAMYNAGATHAAAGHTANRPTATLPGEPYFDTHLDRPIWRNSANTAWIDASGAEVPDDWDEEAPDEGPDDAEEGALDPAAPPHRKAGAGKGKAKQAPAADTDGTPV